MRNDTDYDEKKFDVDEYGNLIPREDDNNNFCSNCGQHFTTHNDDECRIQD